MDIERTHSRPRRMRALLPFLFGAIWCALVAWGGASLGRHAWTPGSVGETPSQWPVASPIPRAADAFTLLLFAHPQCPCVRTSLDEVARIAVEHPKRLHMVVIIYHPVGQGQEWSEPFRREIADQVPAALIVDDLGLVETKRFGVRTSGQTMLFATDGTLVFDGGITAGRGHAGENAGAASMRAALAGKVTASRAPVFGCSLGLEGEGD